MRRKVPVFEWKCDGCGKTVLVETDDMPPGVVGQAFEHAMHGGGWGGEFWACSRECVQAAVAFILDDEENR